MSCCSKEDDGRKSCCGCGRNRAGSTGMCMCIPYEDGFMIAAQVISIFAFCICWVWWVTFVIGFTVFIMLQVIWCCRHKTTFGLYITAGMAALASIMCIVASTYMLVKWRNKAWCHPFFVIDSEFDDDDDYYTGNSDYCREGAWATVSFILAIMYFVISACIFYFLTSGRHAELEQKLQLQHEAASSTTTNIEMGTVEQQEQPIEQQEPPSATFATVEAVAAADSYMPPDASEKIDDVA